MAADPIHNPRAPLTHDPIEGAATASTPGRLPETGQPPGDPAITVVGLGRIGSAFARAFRQAGYTVVEVTRERAKLLEQPLPGPMVVATRLRDLEALVPGLHPANRSRLVLVQNGYLPPVLKRLELEPVTVGVLYLAATDRVSPPRPGLPSVFYGPQAATVTDGLQRGGIDARVASSEAEMRAEEATKILWLSSVAALSAARKCQVDALVTGRLNELETLLDELLTAAGALYGITLDRERVLNTLVTYSLAIPGYQGSGAELEERNLLLWHRGATGAFHRAILTQLGASPPE